MAELEKEDLDALARSERAGHELRDAHVWKVAGWVSGLLGVLALSLVGMYWLTMRLVVEPEVQVDVVRTREPMSLEDEDVQSNQQATRQRQEAAQRILLETYGWVEPSAGVARIPVERAMAVLAERGDLSFPKPPAAEGEEDGDQQSSRAGSSPGERAPDGEERQE